MPELYVQVKNKIAINSKPIVPVCDNNDYVIIFDFDEEWNSLKTKTARFIYNKNYTDVIFDDNKCPLPIIRNTNSFTVGVFAGDLHTTTPAYFRVNRSILSGTEAPAPPEESSVYNKIMEKLNQIREDANRTNENIGSLSDLETESKDNLVDAINEVGSIQPDWNQNDETVKGYIHNRTHYTYVKTEPIYNEEEHSGAILIDGYQFSPEENNKYRVIFDGVPYDVVGKNRGLDIVTIGNFYFASHRVNDDTGEPFLIFKGGFYPVDTKKHSVCIFDTSEKVNTLDPKYIEDMYYTKTIPGNTLLCAFDTTGGKHNSVELAFPLVVGSVYNLTIDGDLYGGNVTIDHGTMTLNCAQGVLIVEPHNPLLGRWDGNPLKRHIEIAEYNRKIIKQIDPKYIPNQSTVFEARLFPHSSVPCQLTLESGITTDDLVKAFDKGQQVIARVCTNEEDDGIPFEMQNYVSGSSGSISKIMFAPFSVPDVQSGGAIGIMNTMVIGFGYGNWYYSYVALDAVGGLPIAPYTVPFEVYAKNCNTFGELVSATQNFRWRAYIYKGNHKLYLQIPEYSSSVTPSVLQFTGITEPDYTSTSTSKCVWTTIQIEVSPSNVILWDASTLPTFNSALDTWDNYKLDKDQSGILCVYDVFNDKIDLGLVDTGVIAYQGHQYLFDNASGAFLRFYCMGFNSNSEPKISTIELNRRSNTVTVTDFHPLWETATESEVNDAVNDIFKTI